MEEVDAYMAQDPIPCLFCGKLYHSLHQHVWHTHGMKADDYKEQFGIPWTRGLISPSMKEKQAAIMNAQREQGILPAQPSAEHIAKLAILSKNRRPLSQSVRKAQSDHALNQHGRTEKLSRKDFEEFLRRIATGRTITEVGNDSDTMRRETFDVYCRKHPDFGKKVEKVLDNLPFDVQVRGHRPGKRFKKTVVKLREENNLTWPEVAKIMSIQESTARSTYHNLKKRGELDDYRTNKEALKKQ